MRGAPILAVTVMLASVVLAGCLQDDVEDTEPQETTGQSQTVTGPHAVVAVIDSGINPYHAAFRDDSPRAYEHPSTYLEDYPESAVAINLTFDHSSIGQALQADCEQWEQVEAGELYWFPGTRIVGAYASPGNWEDLPYQDSSRGPITCDDTTRAAWGNIFGSGSHGTGVASRAAANEYGACEECLIVAVQGLGPHPVLWAAEQPWIDLTNHSWGPQVPLFQPSGMPVPRLFADPELVRAVETAAQKQTAFWASGNGLGFRYGVIGHPTQAGFHMTPSAIRVGGHDNGQITIWHGSSPHIVADACGSLTADHESIDDSGPFPSGGTSHAAPYAAGLAAKILLEARILLDENRTGVRDGVLAQGPPLQDGPLQDGAFTKQEFERLVSATATLDPQPNESDGRLCDPTEDPLNNPTDLIIPALPVAWGEVPEGAGIPLVGYGAVTPETVAHATAVLRGEAPLPKRTAADAYFETDRTYREGMHSALAQVP